MGGYSLYFFMNRHRYADLRLSKGRIISDLADSQCMMSDPRVNVYHFGSVGSPEKCNLLKMSYVRIFHL
ncbi:hypothetical protein GCM10022392_19790 [Mucilaginibacter panaciglaebae]|uniref:Uncharacterized protein n=1 Tax=Mucilaginibacter panaciglaebae TaxID=502331 RepID=A0ABP7WTJ7_9SPHI